MALIRHHLRLVGALGVLLATLVAVLAVILLAQPQRSPFTHHSARAWWERQALHHYTMEVRAQAGRTDLHLLLEVRDEQLVGGVNLRTGSQLSADDLMPYLVWLPIDHLFDWIELQSYGDKTWRHQVADLAPWVAQRIGWCLARPTRVSYDPQLGYPATIRVRQNVCSPNDPLEVQISVTPLPN